MDLLCFLQTKTIQTLSDFLVYLITEVSNFRQVFEGLSDPTNKKHQMQCECKVWD
jgi:hypothetical protein